jgi:hypothetical protein
MPEPIVEEFTGRYFDKVDKAVSPDRIRRDKTYLSRVLRVGIELESANIPEDREDLMERDLKADRNYDQFNGCVERVYADPSIRPCGLEVVFKGNSESFDGYHKALTEVEKTIKRFSTGRVNNESCSAHITILTGQDRALPSVYLANYYQLFRKYADAILWLCGANYEGSAIVRAKLGYYAQPQMTLSPIARSMRTIAEQGSDNVRDRKYVAMAFRDNGDDRRGQKWISDDLANGLFVEFRFLDRIVQPIALTSIKCMLEAMLFKAVELSEFGILNVDADGEASWYKTKAMTRKITDGEIILSSEKDYLRQKAKLLIDFISPNLKSFDGKSLSVLYALAEKPIHQRYDDGDSDDKIERDLTPKVKEEYSTERDLRRIIQLQLIKIPTTAGRKAKAGEWERKVADALGVSERMIRHTLAKLEEQYSLSFDREIGSFVLKG